MQSVAEILARGHSRATAQTIADGIINGILSLDELIEIFYSQDMRSCQHSSWALELIARQSPSLLEPYMSRMIAELDNSKAIQGVYRNTMRVWQFMPISQDYEGEVLDKAFEYFSAPQMAVAIRVFAMTICTNLAERFPELAPEIITVIEDNWDHTTPAWRSRGKMELRRLRKILDKEF